MTKQLYYAIGTMSGTSMDGVDVAMIVSDGGKQIDSIAHVSRAYPNSLRTELKAMAKAMADCQGDEAAAKAQCPFWQLALTQLHGYHVEAIEALLAQTTRAVDVIGFHGQTVFHNPAQHQTLQIGLADQLRQRFEVPVVHQFRQNDVALGGQGAPLAPAYHQALVLRDQVAPAIVVNCGGISNATVVEGEGWHNVCASDLGPGNGLLDRLVAQVTDGAQHFDRDGAWGLQGRLDQALLQQLWQTAVRGNTRDFVDQPWPKSLDIHDLQLPEFARLSGQDLYDACYTLAYFTADVIVQSIKPVVFDHPYHWLLCGGGWNNPVILQCLRDLVAEHFSGSQVSLSQALDWHPQAVEAEIFAYLAIRRLLDLPASGPNTTGVPQPCLAGSVVV